ncbi:hypothetical protein TMatcc_005571 [Talaromyces marneffei ATCC 18224]|uniref:Uncharacterized protein n=1 Tax=Talaromyces marneffei (strain ATCC 18224 / CBS 334.59 / QM 7333) TaxID=441960 RepID=B6QA18_TALMQ|nr:conserved hypothetical protein [Talaromyces marneffei ATCC 18224]
MAHQSNSTSSTHVISFFDDFPDFVPDPSAGIRKNFARLAAHRQWKTSSKKYKRNWNKYVRMEFDKAYGTNHTRLESWQNLCIEVGIGHLSSITQCKKALSKINVNIVDSMECRWSGNKPRLFPSLNSLRNYTKEHDLYFPRDAAKKEGFVKILLKPIL